MEERLIINYFHDGSYNKSTAYANLSWHCNFSENEIKIYSGPNFRNFECYIEGLTFPNIVYIESLFLYANSDIRRSFPDLKKIGELLSANPYDIDDLGNIASVDVFMDMTEMLDPEKIKKLKQKITCKPLGDDMYRFTSRKGTWDIKVNSYD